MVQTLPFRYDLVAANPQDVAVKNDLASAPAPAPLDGDSAFVVHLTSTDSRHSGVVSGRVEHVTSGRSMRFSSTTQLVEFMSGVVDEGRHAAREGSKSRSLHSQREYNNQDANDDQKREKI